MAIDVKRLVDAIQKKEHAVTSSTSTQDMIDILKAAKKLQGSVINSYADSSYLPDPLTTNERIAYLEDTKVIRLNNGIWDDPTGGVETIATYSFQGTVSGYSAGGDTGSNVIDKFSLSSDANASDVGDLLTVRGQSGAGQTSLTHGHITGGTVSSPSVNVNTIEKYTFSVDQNATDVGDMTVARRYIAGQSSSSNGYSSGGFISAVTNVVDKFPFAADGNATDVGDLTQARYGPTGQSSSTHGYSSGGDDYTPVTNTIDKFPFAADANATDVGNLTIIAHTSAGQSSTTHGYSSGGLPAPSRGTVIDKFSFSADGNATDVGDLTRTASQVAGQSSTTHGYSSGGVPGPQNTIDKFSFTSDGNATDVGDLTVARSNPAGSQS